MTKYKSWIRVGHDSVVLYNCRPFVLTTPTTFLFSSSWPLYSNMTTFQALMALSETQTRQSQSAVQTALAQRQQKEEMRRKQLAEQDRKEQALAKQRRQKIFDDEKREQERQQKLEQERAAREAVLQKREEEARNNLLYGPKKAKARSAPPDGASPKWPSSSSQARTREDVRKRRVPGEDEDDSAPEFLTREEKRERKQQMEMRKLFNASKRTSNAASYSKAGRRLPGGAVDVPTTSSMADSAGSSKSVKERIAAMPNTLTKLNTVKRDTRTIDEILQDRAKAKEFKTLDGDEAREFNDWFGTSKKKEAVKKSSAQPSVSAATSGANTPASQGGSSTPHMSGAASRKVAPPQKSSLLKTAATKAAYSISAGAKPVPAFRPSPSDRIHSSSKTAPGKSSKATASSSAGGVGRSTGFAGKKRPRSLSPSDDESLSPPSPKRHNNSSVLGDTIWRMFGRERNSYVSKDVFSDDEDMEADATLLEREEKMSARIAKKEDTIALEEERRREEEKRRRKKEKDARERRN
ncbi:hypothetical protein FPV67DRAFT_1482071 [Lyophyllum atratum]|nr:hypothetical protein FPV67DRAFT_1482071 [Lyophyllum atratum]